RSFRFIHGSLCERKRPTREPTAGQEKPSTVRGESALTARAQQRFNVPFWAVSTAQKMPGVITPAPGTDGCQRGSFCRRKSFIPNDLTPSGLNQNLLCYRYTIPDRNDCFAAF